MKTLPINAGFCYYQKLTLVISMSYIFGFLKIGFVVPKSHKSHKIFLDKRNLLWYNVLIMFIREVCHKNKKNNTIYSTYKLVESVRTKQGPRQKAILNLGVDFNLPKDEWKLLACRIEELLEGRKSLFTGHVSFWVGQETHCVISNNLSINIDRNFKNYIC